MQQSRTALISRRPTTYFVSQRRLPLDIPSLHAWHQATPACLTPSYPYCMQSTHVDWICNAVVVKRQSDPKTHEQQTWSCMLQNRALQSWCGSAKHATDNTRIWLSSGNVLQSAREHVQHYAPLRDTSFQKHGHTSNSVLQPSTDLST